MKVKKLKAFTLSELLVVLLLTVVVVGLAFSVLNLVQQQMNGSRQNYQKTTELNLLKQALWRDFRTYQYLNFNMGDEHLHLSSAIDTVRYTFMEDYVVRQQDTFNIDLAAKTFYFDGTAVTDGMIDAIELETNKESGQKQVFVYRENAAIIYMN
ncbi:hypothetical protein [uncultured Croceitalea sp.]|uniref:hypothetical protein n=1 Tax=uncultured Croceitalea sp. TaxID=1798908 RepID=UPI0033064F3E